uniref:Uncharacterized protein n=1 Tax=Amphiprion percula TaxID=161767 RepID=A0A3P8TIZ8_AMPPE
CTYLLLTVLQETTLHVLLMTGNGLLYTLGYNEAEACLIGHKVLWNQLHFLWCSLNSSGSIPLVVPGIKMNKKLKKTRVV